MNRTLTHWFPPALALGGASPAARRSFASTFGRQGRRPRRPLEEAGRQGERRRQGPDGLQTRRAGCESAAEPPSRTRKPAKPPAGAPKPGEVSGKDKDLDSLLEKLGATEDKPAPDERQPGGMPKPADDATPPPSKPGDDKKKPQELKGRDKDVDEHLEELTGKRRKKKNEEEENGPLSEVVKQMREVERRLSQPDTGEETRKKQEQIVKRIETLIEQAPLVQPIATPTDRQNRPMKPGEQPGEPQDQPGENGGNAPFTKAARPENRRSTAGGKDAWGHLPPELRQEMDNVFKEDPLPSREELIRRYYLSVSQKNLARGR